MHSVREAPPRAASHELRTPVGWCARMSAGGSRRVAMTPAVLRTKKQDKVYVNNFPKHLILIRISLFAISKYHSIESRVFIVKQMIVQ